MSIVSKLIRPMSQKIEQRKEAEIDPMEESKGFGLENYLLKSPLSSPLSLSGKGKVSFHWGNWKDSCQFQRQILSKSEEYSKRYFLLKKAMDDLKIRPCWINNKVKTIQLSLYDLYLSYLDPRIRTLWFGEHSNEFLVSFNKAAGPYVPIDSMRWFDKNLYSYFVFSKLLKGESVFRDFRINIHSTAVCHFGNAFVETSKLDTHHFTKNGILFKVKGIDTYNKILISKIIKLEFDTNVFKKLTGLKSPEFIEIFMSDRFDLALSNERRTYLVDVADIIHRYGNMQNYKTSTNDEIFFFIGYENFHELNRYKDLVKDMGSFMDHTEGLFKDELHSISLAG